MFSHVEITVFQLQECGLVGSAEHCAAAPIKEGGACDARGGVVLLLSLPGHITIPNR